MRLLTWIFVIFAGIWSLYWFIGSTALQTGIEQALADAPAQGVDIQYSDLDLRGFPNRFDTTISDVDLSIPREGVRWKAPFFQAFALSYKPYHLVTVWPHEQSLEISGTVFDITSEDLRASLVVEPNTTLALDRFRIAGDALSVSLPDAQSVMAGSLLLATKQNAAKPDAHDVAIDIRDLVPPATLLQEIDPRGRLPESIAAVMVDATVELSAPVVLLNPDTKPQIDVVDIRNGSISWGEQLISANGTLEADHMGFAEGHLRVTVKNWREIFLLLTEAGLVQAEWEPTVAALAAADGKPETLTAPLSFGGGAIRLGVFPIADAPRLRQRQ